MEEVFEIKQLANKGFGIVASKELQPGELVLVEQAGVLGKVIYSKYYKHWKIVTWHSYQGR